MANAIAEAFVRLRPDLTGFRADLERQLLTAVAGVKAPPIPISPQAVGVQAQVGATNVAALTQAAQAGAAAGAQLGATTNKNTAATTKLTQAQRDYNKALEASIAATAKFNAIQTAGIAGSTKLASQALEFSAATRAVVAAQAAFDKALLTTDATLKTETADLLLNARAARENALATLQASRAQTVHAATTGQATKGIVASGAGLLGLRGAVLAASGPFLAAAVAVTALGKSLTTFGDLEETLNVFRASTHATAEQMRDVSEAAKDLGNDVRLPSVSASDAATAMAALARAGLTVEDSIDAARGVLELATAAEIDNAQATDLVASALNAFGLEGSEAVHVADVFANAANAAQGSIADFGVAMQQVAAVSAQVGVSFENTEALLTLLAKAGLRGSDAGTSLRTAFLRLAAPTDEAQQLLTDLNIQVRDLQGNVRPEVFADFAKATEDLAPAVRDAIAATVFGQDAIRAALLAGREGVSGLREQQEALDRSGTAAEIAAARTEGLNGQIEALKSSASTAAAGFGGLLSPAVEEYIGFARDAVTATGFLIEKLQALIDKMGDIPGAKQGKSIFKTALFVGPEVVKGIANIARGGDDVNKALGGASDGAVKFARSIDVGARNFSALNNLQRSVGAFQPLGDTDVVATQIQRVVSDLNTLKGIDPTSDLAETIRTDMDQALNVLLNFGPEGVAAIARAGPQIVNSLDQSLRAAAADFTGIGDLVIETLPADFQRAIDQIARLPGGKQKLRELGADLVDSMAQGIESNDSAVAAARRAVTEAVTGAREAVQSAIRSARGNLESLGSTLADQAAEIIAAAGPAALKLDSLTAALKRLQDQGDRRDADFDLSQAQQALNDMKATLAQIGTPNTAQQAAIDKTLAPFINDVQNAEDAVREVDLTDQIDQQKKLKDQAVVTAREGIAKLVAQFEAGKISAGKFSSLLNRQLAPALQALPKANLGLSFSTEFRRTMTTIVQQAKDLAGFLGTPGTTPGPQSTNVRGTVQEQAQRVKTAQQNLQDALKSNTKDTADNTKRTNVLLAAIRDKINAAPAAPQRKPKPTTKAQTTQENVQGKIG